MKDCDTPSAEATRAMPAPPLRGPSASAVLDIDALRVLAAIAERGGVTAAAERIGRTPAAVSMQLKKLEEIVGRPLFERGARKMTPTKDGDRLVVYARRILGLHDDALRAMRPDPLSGEVRVGVPDEFGPTVLADVFGRFAREHAGVSVSVSMGPTARIAPMLDQGALDVAVVTPGCATPWRDDDILAHREPLIWVGLAGGSAVRRDPLPVAIGTSGCAWRKAAVDSLMTLERAYRVAYASDYYATQVAAVAADLAVAPLPASLMRPDFETLGGEHGLAPLGEARMAMRWAQPPERRSDAARALANEILASYRDA